MTEEDLRVLQSFGAVWERVSGERIACEDEQSVTWQQLLQGVFDHWRDCAGLAKCAHGRQRRTLLCMAEAARAIYRELQTEYFLETGDVFISVNGENFASYTPYNLRKTWKNAVELAKLLQRAENAGCLPVKDAGKTVSDHAEGLKGLISCCLQ